MSDPVATEPEESNLDRSGPDRSGPDQSGPDQSGSRPAASGARRILGDFAPGLVHFTDDVVFGELWPRPQLSAKDRSLVTVAALTTLGATEQLGFHLQRARENGNTDEELVEVITHLAFYAGWPRAMSAMTVAKSVLGDGGSAAGR
jgi:4-carboxymuconolactone decarboxylase